jgi:hypothetical protein
MPHPQAYFGLKGTDAALDGVTVSREQVFHLRMPQRFTSEHIETIRADLAILTEVAEQQPERLMDLQNAVLDRDPAATRIADELGLTEAKMYAKGGGGVWVVVAIIAVGAALLLESDTPHPPPPPKTLPPDGGTG